MENPGRISDEEIVELFLSREERAISETEKKYGRYLLLTANNVLGDEEDSRECVNDALFLLWTHIPQDRPKRFKAYAARIVRNLAINKIAGKTRAKRGASEYALSLDELSEYLEDPSNTEREYDGVLLKNCIDGFVRGQNKRRRYIFVCRYYCFDSVPMIARSLGVSERLVYKELYKMKKTLKEILLKEGFFSDEKEP